VFPVQREIAVSVRLAGIKGWFEIQGSVTNRTIRAVRLQGKFPVVRIFMAVFALIVLHRFSESAALVARVAAEVFVLPDQGEMGQGMIEILSRTIIVPPACRMTGRTPAVILHVMECTAMGIGVAAIAVSE